MLSRGRGVSLALGITLILAVLLAGCGSSQSSSEGSGDGGDQADKLVVGYQTVPNAALVAKQRGLVEDAAGMPVEWKKFDSGASVITAMASGSIDIALAGTTAAAAAIATDLPIQVIGIHDVIAGAEAMVVKDSSGASDLSGLKGKSVAVPFGSTTHYALLRALEEEGLTQKDLKIIDMQPDQMVAAWGSANIDAGYVWEPSLGQMKGDGGNIILSSKDLINQGIVTADLILGRTEFIEQNPKATAGYAKAIDESVELYRSKPDDAVAAVSKEIGLEPDVVEGQMKGLIWLDAKEQISSDYLGTSDKIGALGDTLKETGDFMKDQKEIPSSPDLEAYQKNINPTAFSTAAKK